MQGLSQGSPWSWASNLNSLLIPNILIFAGELSGQLFVLGQQERHQWCSIPEERPHEDTMKRQSSENPQKKSTPFTPWTGRKRNFCFRIHSVWLPQLGHFVMAALANNTESEGPCPRSYELGSDL